MPHNLIQHKDTIQAELAILRHRDSHTHAIVECLTHFQSDAEGRQLLPTGPNFERALASVQNGPKRLLDDLAGFWFDPMITDLTRAEIGRLADALISKYPALEAAPEITAVHTAAETATLLRIRADLGRAEDVLNATTGCIAAHQTAVDALARERRAAKDRLDAAQAGLDRADQALSTARAEWDAARSARAAAETTRNFLKRRRDGAERDYIASGEANAKRRR